MPTYEYECTACKHRFDELQSFSEPPLKKCPACKKNKLQRLIGTGAAILFKGSGFYQTDYRSESYKSAAKAEQSAGSTDKPAGDTAKPTTATTDTAGAASKESKPKPEKKTKS